MSEENLRGLRPSEWRELKEKYSEEEINQYRATDFPSVEEWEEAMFIGAPDIETFNNIKKGGFDSFKDYSDADSAGFSIKSDWESAKNGNFPNRASWIQAKEFKIYSYDEYKNYLTKLQNEANPDQTQTEISSFDSKTNTINENASSEPKLKPQLAFDWNKEGKSSLDGFKEKSDLIIPTQLSREKFLGKPDLERLFDWWESLNNKLEYTIEEFCQIIQMPDIIEAEEFLSEYSEIDYNYSTFGSNLIFTNETKKKLEEILA